MSLLPVCRLSYRGTCRILSPSTSAVTLLSWDCAPNFKCPKKMVTYGERALRAVINDPLSKVTMSSCARKGMTPTSETSETISVLGRSYPRDEWTNITPRVADKLGKNLHLQVQGRKDALYLIATLCPGKLPMLHLKRREIQKYSYMPTFLLPCHAILFVLSSSS